MMNIQMECKHCGQVRPADMDQMMSLLIDTAHNQSVYAGFFCEDCAEELLEEDD